MASITSSDLSSPSRNLPSGPGTGRTSESRVESGRVAKSRASGESPNRPHLRSCQLCRRRKVKCDRQQPCSNCTRSKADCVYPRGPGRAAKQPRRAMESQLVDRLHRLEGMIKHLSSQQREDSIRQHAASGLSLDKGQASEIEARSLKDTAHGSDDANSNDAVDQPVGRLMVEETKSYYISNIMWASLGNEIEELHGMLHESYSEDEVNASSNTTVSENASPPLTTSAALLGFRSLEHSLQQYHPVLSQSVSLLRIFTENVLPLVHILHMPTTERMYWDAIISLDSIDKNTEALFFAIYYSAVISLKSEQCMAIIGMSRENALERYRFGLEQAMSRADLLNTQSIILMQAVVLFLSALRNEDDSRTTWSLTSLVFHLARAMGLHRDGSTFGLKPLETELRRRLWYHICLLDIRSSEYHGYEPIANEAMFDTKPPLNINDSDITAQMMEALPERVEPTEMTLCLIRSEAMRAGWKVSYAPPSADLSGGADSTSLAGRSAIVEEMKLRIEDRYLRYCDTTVPFQFHSYIIARLIIARSWLAVHYPVKRKGDQIAKLDPAMRDRLFFTSIELLELAGKLLTNKDFARWTWHSKTHIQWHAVVFVLSEICSRPACVECDQAWEYINIVYDERQMKENKKRGALWRPIKRLMAKARYVRDRQKMEQSGGFSTNAPLQQIPGEALQLGAVPMYDPAATYVETNQEVMNQQGVLEADGSTPFLDIFLDNLDVDIFGEEAPNTAFFF